MNRPNVNIFAKTFLPTSKFAFASNVRDYRLLWAVNCGSLSNLPVTPIYEPSKLSQQLDTVIRFVSCSFPLSLLIVIFCFCRMSLERQIVIPSDNTIVLPQLCQWFLKDFETEPDGTLNGTNLSNKQLLLILSKYLRCGFD
jgi:hypothetical protein